MSIIVRQATIEDLPRIIEMKKAMFQDIGTFVLRNDFDEFILTEYRGLVQQDAMRHFLACDGVSIVACSGAFVRADPPYCYFEPGNYGFVGDVFTEHAYRKQGLALELSRLAIAWLTSQGVTFIKLKASDAGRPLYELLGFEATDDMILSI